MIVEQGDIVDRELDADGVEEVLIWLEEEEGRLLDEDVCELEVADIADDVLDWDAIEDVLPIELDAV